MFLKFKPLFLVFTAAAICAPAFSASAAAAASQSAPQSASEAKERSRLEELFIWKTSEELRLAPAEEQKFNDAIHALNKRRRDANTHMDAALSALATVKTKADAEKALAAHRAALHELQAASNAEIDKLKPLLGPQKLAQYLVAKNSILEKLKSMLAAPAVQTSGSAPASGLAAKAAPASSAVGAGSNAATAATVSGSTTASPAPVAGAAVAVPSAASAK